MTIIYQGVKDKINEFIGSLFLQIINFQNSNSRHFFQEKIKQNNNGFDTDIDLKR